MPSNQRICCDLVDIVYEDCLRAFYFMHNDYESLTLMEDSARIHCSLQALFWRNAHRIRKFQWPVNSLDLNLIENVWSIVKDVVKRESMPRNKEELVQVIERV